MGTVRCARQAHSDRHRRLGATPRRRWCADARAGSGSPRARPLEPRDLIAMASVLHSGDALDDIGIFRLLTDDERQLVAARCERLTYAFGSIVVREGDDADAM